MDIYWEETVIMTCKWHNLFSLRQLSKNCLSLCDQKFNIYNIRILNKIMKVWRACSKRRPHVNSWCRKIVHPDQRHIISF